MRICVDGFTSAGDHLDGAVRSFVRPHTAGTLRIPIVLHN